MSFSYILLLTVVCFVMHAFIKEISFKYYAIYGILLITYLLLKNNTAIDFIHQTFNERDSRFISNTYNWMIQVFFYNYYFLFCYYFLNLHKVHVKLTKFITKLFTIIVIASVALACVAYYIQDDNLFKNFFLHIYLPIILLLAITSVRHGIHASGPLKYYLLTGGIVYIVFALIALFGSITETIEFPIRYFLIGIIFENLFFGLGLALKFKLITEEKNHQESKAIILEGQNKIAALEGVMQGESKERRRIASDLHDSIGNLLTAANMQLSLAKKGNESIPLNKASEIVGTTSEEVRRIAHHMRSLTLEKLGLLSALKELCGNLKKNSELDCQFSSDIEDIRLNDFQETNLYRIVQELVSNIIKHADAEYIRMQLNISNNILKMRIIYNGIPFDPNGIESNGMGLKNIEQRVEVLNGSITYSRSNAVNTTAISFSMKNDSN